MNILKDAIHRLGRAYVNKIVESEVSAQNFKRHNERPIEFRFVFECLADIQPITLLDVGTGTTALPHMIASCGCVVTAIDNIEDYWPAGMINRHWQVINDDITKPSIDSKFDMITCISVIEHIEEHGKAFIEMAKLLKSGGHLIVTLPYNEKKSVPNVYDLPDAAYGESLKYICRSTSRAELDDWLDKTSLKIVRQEYWKFWTGEVWTQGEALKAPQKVNSTDPHQLSCLLFANPAG